MPIQFDGTTGYLRHNARIVTGFPMSIVFSYANESGQPSGFTTVMQGCEFAEPFLSAAFITFGDQKQASHRHVGGTRSAAKLTTPHPNTTTMQWGVVVFTSANSRTVYFGDAAGVTDTTAGSDASAGHDITTIGASLRNSAAATQFTKGHIGEVHFYSTALTASDVTALIGGATPESLAGRVDGWWLDTFQAGGTYTSTSGTRVMTAVGTVSSSGLTHPITRSSPSAFTGNITLDAVGTSGTFQGVAAGAFAGAITLDDVGVAGSFGASSGTLTSEPIRTNNGTLLASTALAHVAIYNDTTGALVLRRTSISTDASGVFTVTDPAIVAGVTYRIDWETSGGHRRMPRKLAA